MLIVLLDRPQRISFPIDTNSSQHLDDLILKSKYAWMTMIEGRLAAMEQALTDAKEHGKKSIQRLYYRIENLNLATERLDRHWKLMDDRLKKFGRKLFSPEEKVNSLVSQIRALREEAKEMDNDLGDVELEVDLLKTTVNVAGDDFVALKQQVEGIERAQ